MTDLRHIESWIFDLDNTLYAAQCQLFAQIDARMTAFIQAKLEIPYDNARKLQKEYYVRYGATMSGLMTEHNVCPDEFLSYVHDIDLAPVSANPALAAALEKLPGKRYIFTNGSVQHAENVAGALGVYHLFDGVFDIKAAGYTPKPRRAAYDLFLRRYGVNAKSAIMFEDLSQNLQAPHALGMTTVLICSDAAWLADEPRDKRPARPGDAGDHIDYTTQDLSVFLAGAVTGPMAAKTA